MRTIVYPEGIPIRVHCGFGWTKVPCRTYASSCSSSQAHASSFESSSLPVSLTSSSSRRLRLLLRRFPVLLFLFFFFSFLSPSGRVGTQQEGRREGRHE